MSRMFDKVKIIEEVDKAEATIKNLEQLVQILTFKKRQESDDICKAVNTVLSEIKSRSYVHKIDYIDGEVPIHEEIISLNDLGKDFKKATKVLYTAFEVPGYMLR